MKLFLLLGLESESVCSYYVSDTEPEVLAN